MIRSARIQEKKVTLLTCIYIQEEIEIFHNLIAWKLFFATGLIKLNKPGYLFNSMTEFNLIWPTGRDMTWPYTWPSFFGCAKHMHHPIHRSLPSMYQEEFYLMRERERDGEWRFCKYQDVRFDNACRCGRVSMSFVIRLVSIHQFHWSSKTIKFKCVIPILNFGL
jgi:hypothetical protein